MKKNLLFSTLILAGMVVFFNSCKDSEKVNSGTFTVDGTKYSLKSGFAVYDGEEPNGDDTFYDWIVVLTSNGLDFNGPDGFTGTGDLVYMNIQALNIEGSTQLPTGVFTYPIEAGKHNVTEGGIYLNYVAETDDGDEVDLSNVETAIVNITKSGSRYTITFTLTRTGDDDLVITYTGTIKVVGD